MAEQIPYGLAVSVVNNLALLAFREVGRIYGFSDELESLARTVELIQAKISDAEESQHQDRTGKIWIRRLREVLQNADNLFDELLMHDLRRKVNCARSQQVRDLFSSENQLLFRHTIARRVEIIRKLLDGVYKDISPLDLKPSTVISNHDVLEGI